VTLKVFAVGDILAAADVNEYLVNTKYAEKLGAGTTRVSTTTLAVDPDLSLHLDANKTYWIEMLAPVTSPAAAGFKWSFNVPAGAVFTGYANYALDSTGGSYYVYSSGNRFITANISNSSSGGGTDDLVQIRGTLDTAGTASNFSFLWAQNVSNGGNTIVRSGSFMLARRVS
jgi:hypothetical protein